jgi:hypothetical protein
MGRYFLADQILFLRSVPDPCYVDLLTTDQQTNRPTNQTTDWPTHQPTDRHPEWPTTTWFVQDGWIPPWSTNGLLYPSFNCTSCAVVYIALFCSWWIIGSPKISWLFCVALCKCAMVNVYCYGFSQWQVWGWAFASWQGWYCCSDEENMCQKKGLLYAPENSEERKKGTLSDQPQLIRVTSTVLLSCWGWQSLKDMTSLGTDFEMHAIWQGYIEDCAARDFAARKACTNALSKARGTWQSTLFTSLEIPWGFLTRAVLHSLVGLMSRGKVSVWGL